MLSALHVAGAKLIVPASVEASHVSDSGCCAGELASYREMLAPVRRPEASAVTAALVPLTLPLHTLTHWSAMG
jgi:hypothetical protein